MRLESSPLEVLQLVRLHLWRHSTLPEPITTALLTVTAGHNPAFFWSMPFQNQGQLSTHWAVIKPVQTWPPKCLGLESPTNFSWWHTLSQQWQSGPQSLTLMTAAIKLAMVLQLSNYSTTNLWEAELSARSGRIEVSTTSVMAPGLGVH